MPSSTPPSDIVPAHLDFFAIYNPSLGGEHEDLKDEIVYFFDGEKSKYVSHGKQDRRDLAKGSKDEENRQLRSVGLAKGMIQFSEDFSNGNAVDCIETDKSRTLIHNLDGGWWLLASVALTCLPRLVDQVTIATEPHIKLEYSSREVAPAQLLQKQLLKSHSVFLLHHGSSVADIWQRSTRDKFCNLLQRFWDPFLHEWNVLLHDNPAADMFDGIRLSAGGELGVGVGEEAWGSGEREVLEGFAHRTEGLIDMVVCRHDHIDATDGAQPSHGREAAQQFADWAKGGVIFSGLDHITRSSVRAISAWADLIRKQGMRAYGIEENPNSKRRHRQRSEKKGDGEAVPERAAYGNSNSLREDNAAIPAPIVRPKPGAKSSPDQTSTRPTTASARKSPKVTGIESEQVDQASLGDEMMKYLTLGIYGSTWGIPAGRPAARESRVSSPMGTGSQALHDLRVDRKSGRAENRYLVGLLGDLEHEQPDEEDEDAQQEHANSRISLRHLYVQRIASAEGQSMPAVEIDSLTQDESPVERVRTIVYVQHPFIFIFLFEARTSSLALPLFYRSIHHQLGPLKRSLMNSTDPQKLNDRLRDIMAERGATATKGVGIGQSLVYDPIRRTIHNSIPDIPDAAPQNSTSPGTWSRLEALSVHSQILNTYMSTRRLVAERELTSKTSRGWWVVWMRLPPSPDEPEPRSVHHREAILIRKSNDHVAPKSRQTSSALSFGFGRRESPDTKGVGIADGVGFDVKQYIEALVTLSR